MPASLIAAALLLLQSQSLEKIVVTTAPPLDAERLSDALRVYLDEFGIRIESAPIDQARDLHDRIADARQLGTSVRAVAVIRAERGTPGEVEIELYDLATEKTLIATVPKPTRDEDLYRTLALKIQAILRATLSEARASLDPGSAIGRLVSEGPPEATGSPSLARPHRALAFQAGYAAVSLVAGDVVLQGLSVAATFSLPRRVDLSLGTAALGSVHASGGGVDAVANVVPLYAAARVRWRRKWAEISIGPCAEVALVSVTSVSATVPVRSVRDIIVALGIEVEGRLTIKGPTWIYARADALGVLEGPRYDVAGVPVLDTSRLQVSAGGGAGLSFL